MHLKTLRSFLIGWACCSLMFYCLKMIFGDQTSLAKVIVIGLIIQLSIKYSPKFSAKLGSIFKKKS